MSWGFGTATPPETAFRPRSPPLRADHPPSLSPSLGSSIFGLCLRPWSPLPPREDKTRPPRPERRPLTFVLGCRPGEACGVCSLPSRSPAWPPSPSGRRQCPKRFDGETFRPPFSRSTSPWASSRCERCSFFSLSDGRPGAWGTSGLLFMSCSTDWSPFHEAAPTAPFDPFFFSVIFLLSALFGFYGTCTETVCDRHVDSWLSSC